LLLLGIDLVLEKSISRQIKKTMKGDAIVPVNKKEPPGKAALHFS
jgi:hypothetical protein